MIFNITLVKERSSNIIYEAMFLNKRVELRYLNGDKIQTKNYSQNAFTEAIEYGEFKLFRAWYDTTHVYVHPDDRFVNTQIDGNWHKIKEYNFDKGYITLQRLPDGAVTSYLLTYFFHLMNFFDVKCYPEIPCDKLPEIGDSININEVHNFYVHDYRLDSDGNPTTIFLAGDFSDIDIEMLNPVEYANYYVNGLVKYSYAMDIDYFKYLLISGRIKTGRFEIPSPGDMIVFKLNNEKNPGSYIVIGIENNDIILYRYVRHYDINIRGTMIYRMPIGEYQSQLTNNEEFVVIKNVFIIPEEGATIFYNNIEYVIAVISWDILNPSIVLYTDDISAGCNLSLNQYFDTVGRVNNEGTK